MRIVFLFPLLFLVHVLLHAQVLKAKVVKISDGDTFTALLDNNEKIRVRLHGIDCPEKGQDFANVAKEYISSLITGKSVTILPTKTDRYGRTVARCSVRGRDLSCAQVAGGFAVRRYAPLSCP